ncbi:HD-GYP domain-containing protein [Desulfofustis limnaeus]|jgi:HD-GYP domain-containing protein (c-di-GMP phosphodiesterase class II)|uniref:HD domain-containing protein n=1 Tax=Desulfofustis limnaeus TaxID=2740163 RepID=A0ABM7W4K4_9BACT|nr:HD domain-containing phosphohydrolase [Desulfofustis limnaeus]MDX9895997.1 HD domain-containing phosphohydrolase [Desulfofustis sp.]BDD85831.1 hypothetical protein DPPLL_01960 [Desulfofustis limnaeus]
MKPLVFKREIHFRLIRRIALVGLLALLFGTVALLWLEYHRLHDLMLNNAKRESGLFTAILLQSAKEPAAIPPTVRDHLLHEAFQQTNFVTVEITTTDQHPLFDAARADGAPQFRQPDDAGRVPVVATEEKDQVHFLDNRFYLTFATLLRDPHGRHTIALLDALYRLSLTDLKNRATTVALGFGVLTATVILCCLFLYPGMLFLQHRIITGSGAATRANGFLLTWLATAMSACDGTVSRHHHLRVVIYAVRLAEKQHVSRIATRGMVQAALLRDLERLDQPANLQQAGDSSQQDKQLIAAHRQFAQKIKQQRWFAEAEPVIRAMHERYDGSGYPAGLQGESIPMGARILAIADHFDRLTVPGAVQDPRDLEGALHCLERESATRFDPVLVASFTAVAPRIYQRLVEADEAHLNRLFAEIIHGYLPS